MIELLCLIPSRSMPKSGLRGPEHVADIGRSCHSRYHGITYGLVSQRTASPERPLILPGALLSDADVSSCYHLRRLHPTELMQLPLLPPWPVLVEFRV